MKLTTAVLAGLLAVLSALCASPTPAEAQALRTWVSGVGDDANPCSRNAPCHTFQGAIAKTATGGKIDCLDAGGFGTVQIAKSITIDCHDEFASILIGSGIPTAISIYFDAFQSTDTQKSVRLRNINLNGSGSGNYGVAITGGTKVAGGTVIVEDCVIDGMLGSPGHGIVDTRSNGGALFVSHSTIRDVAGNGVEVAPASGSVAISVLLYDVRVQKANFGLTIGSGVTAMVKNSVFSANANGLEADGGAQLNIDNSSVNANTTGIWALGTVRISNSDVAFNTTAVLGTLTSFSNSRFSGNATLGTIDPVGSPTKPTGQQ